MSVELRHLRYFVAVAEELHFARAAARLFVSAPALSVQIRKLEETLGTPLLRRSTRRVELTEAGEVFLARARALLVDADDAVEEIRRRARGDVGHLAVGITPQARHLVAPLLLREFVLRFPDVSVVKRDEGTSQLLAAVVDGSLDVALGHCPERVAGLGYATVRFEPLILAVSTQSDLAQRASELRLGDLRDERWILPSRDKALGFNDVFTALCDAEGFSPKRSIERSDYDEQLQAVADGDGVEPLTVDFVGTREPPSGVVFKPLALRLPLELFWRRDAEDSGSVVANFVDTAVGIAAAQGWLDAAPAAEPVGPAA